MLLEVYPKLRCTANQIDRQAYCFVAHSALYTISLFVLRVEEKTMTRFNKKMKGRNAHHECSPAVLVKETTQR